MLYSCFMFAVFNFTLRCFPFDNIQTLWTYVGYVLALLFPPHNFGVVNIMDQKYMSYRLCFCRWFKLGNNVYSGKEDWLYSGQYWQRNWKLCPDIF